MSLGNQQRGGAQFLKIKAGKFYLSTDKEESTPFDTLEGHLTNIYQKTEQFNGKDIEKTYFVITSEEGSYQFNLSTGSSQWFGFISFLKNTSPRDPMKIQASEGKVTSNGNVSTNLFINQDGPIKAFYKKDGPNKLPEWKKVTVGKTEHWDSSEWEDALLKDLEEIKSKIGSDMQQPKQQPFNPAAQQPQLNSQGFPPPDDKFDDSELPF